jgi:hypothetical protein
MNKKLKDGYSQVAVWRGTTLGDMKPEEFEKDFSKELGGIKVQFLECIETLPDLEFGERVPGTGGRSDLLIAIKDEDIGKFALSRLKYGISWIEDAIDNDPHVYPERIYNYSNKHRREEKKVKLDLVGVDSNIFVIFGKFSHAAKRQGFERSWYESVIEKAQAQSNFDAALGVILEHIED